MAETKFHIENMTIVPRQAQLVLMMATGALDNTTGPTQVLVDACHRALCVYAITHTVSGQGVVAVAVSAQNQGGDMHSAQAGRPGAWRSIGLDDKDVRVRVEEPLLDLWLCVPAHGSVISRSRQYVSRSGR